jgi:aerobic C4-dicarboxylate transport protein
VATVVIASWVGDIDKDRARRILDGESVSAPDLPVVETIAQNIGKPDPLSRPQM